MPGFHRPAREGTPGSRMVQSFRVGHAAHNGVRAAGAHAALRRLSHGFLLSTAAIALTAAMPLSPAAAGETVLPTGGSVTMGSASIATTGPASLVINQTSPAAAINWQSFSLSGNASAHFENGTGATLNRVTGNVPSRLDGSLTATGSLYLVNPAGVTVGTGGMVATGGSFVASTQDVTNSDFSDGGSLLFSGTSKAAIVNEGTISSALGDVALIARSVDNSGDISAPNGTAGLIAGYQVLMQDVSGPNGKFAVKLGGPDTQVVNSGTIRAATAELRANGGNVLALAGNTKGVISATGVTRSGGRVFLTAGGGKVVTRGRVVARRRAAPAAPAGGGDIVINADVVDVGGLLDASGPGGKGGTIGVGGRDISLTSATLDASGATAAARSGSAVRCMAATSAI